MCKITDLVECPTSDYFWLGYGSRTPENASIKHFQTFCITLLLEASSTYTSLNNSESISR
jgi:hypothetical protein